MRAHRIFAALALVAATSACVPQAPCPWCNPDGKEIPVDAPQAPGPVSGTERP